MGVYAPTVVGVYTCSILAKVSPTGLTYTTRLTHAQERASVHEELYINKESTLSGEGNAAKRLFYNILCKTFGSS